MHKRMRPEPDETGETLIELIIAVAIMGITVVAIVGGVATTILISDIHRKQATAGTYVRSYGEAVVTYDAVPNNFNANVTPGALQTAVNFAAPTGFNATVTQVLCWDDTGNPNAFGACSASSASTVQKVMLIVASADARASESLAVVVRKP